MTEVQVPHQGTPQTRRRSAPGAASLVSALLAAVLAIAGAAGGRGGVARAQESPPRPPATRGLPYAPLGADAASDTVAPAVPREFRAVWVATVTNIDWPSRPGLPTQQQQAELLALLDRAQQLRLNAIILQVRPGADALYPSRLEPWSFFLTGQTGKAPDPFWDPLDFAIRESHKRGMELHAWFNPYRARHPRDTTRRLPPNHIARARPELVKKYGPWQWMDPGEADVRRLTTRVILDVVNRYDVDGIHIDDYFYPYKETQVVGRGRRRRRVELDFPDDRSWTRYRANGGTLARDEWRRENVDKLVGELYREIKKAKPWVKFGISPFGIWRPGYPSMVRGLDAYSELYADSRRWLNEGWLDYWTPQLYWKSDAPAQPYVDLLAWWRGENRHARNIWPGNYTSRATSFQRTIWPVTEIFDQIALTRAQLGGASGNVHFSMEGLMANRDGIVERLVAGPYHEPALVPASPWLSAGNPDAPLVTLERTPQSLDLSIRRGDEEAVAGRAPLPVRAAPSDRTETRAGAEARRSTDPHWWVVRARYSDGWRAVVVHAAERMVRLLPDVDGAWPTVVAVTAIDHAGVESARVGVP